MKKFPFVLLCAATVALIGCNKKDNKGSDVEPEPDPEPMEIVVGSMENEAGGIQCAEENIWQGTEIGANQFTSGSYTFTSWKNESTYEYEGEELTTIYFDGVTVSSETANTSTGYEEAFRSTKGGAYAGKNFGVWYPHWGATEDVVCEAHVIPGFYINNTAYTVEAINHGLYPARPFTEEDVLKLIITGKLEGEVQGKIEVELASNGKYIAEWTYVPLALLGEVDALAFEITSTDTGEFGINTPTYFCFDNLGAEMPEGYVIPERADIVPPAPEPEEEGGESGEGGEEA